MSQTNNDAPAANAFELTTEETAALDAAQADAQAGAAAAKTEGADAATGAERAADAGASAAAGAAGADTAGATAAAGDAAAAAAAAAQPAAGTEAAGTPPAAATSGDASVAAPAPVFTPIYQTATRDFGAEEQAVRTELQTLRTQYRAGEVDEDTYERQFDTLQDRLINTKAEAAAARATAAISESNAEQAWEFTQRQFLSLPENAALASNPILMSAFGTAMQEAFNDAAAKGVQLSDWDMMQAGRRLLADSGLLQASTPRQDPAAAAATAASTATTPPPKPDRAPPMGAVPPSMTQVPAAVDVGTGSGADTYAGMDIEDVEARLAAMGDADRENLLRGVPGAFVANQ